METLLYLYFLVMLITWISLSSCVCKTARRLNRDGDVWFLFSLFFSPILGAIMVHCLGPIKKEEIEKPAWPSDEEKLMKKNEKTLEELYKLSFVHGTKESILFELATIKR